MNLVNLTDYTPVERYDAQPWTAARLEEAPAATGPWTAIETFTLTPDVDPRHPAAHSFTSAHATLDSGWYRIVWTDAALRESASPPAHNDVVAPFTPTLADVGKHIRPRTRDRDGNFLGTFSGTTEPTDAQVEAIITESASKVTAKIGSAIAEPLWEKARVVIALRAAMFIELSFFGDQIRAGRSPYNELKALHDEEWKELYSDWRDLGPDGLPGTADDTGDGGLPSFWFPELGVASRAPGSETANGWSGVDW